MKRVNCRGAVTHLCYVDSDTEPETEYQIARKPDGALKCACMAYVFNKEKPKTCKHLKAFDGGAFETVVSVARGHHPPTERAAVIISGTETFRFRRAITFGAVPGGQT